MLYVSNATRSAQGDGACGIRLQSGESEGRHKNSSAAHTPTHGRAQVTQEQLLAASAAAGAAFSAAAACQRPAYTIPQSPSRGAVRFHLCLGRRMMLSIAPKPSCNRESKTLLYFLRVKQRICFTSSAAEATFALAACELAAVAHPVAISPASSGYGIFSSHAPCSISAKSALREEM